MTQTQGRPLIEFLGLDDPCPAPRLTSVLVCAYRSVSVETFESVINLLTRGTWRYAVRSGDAWIGRARSVIASQWYRETDDDVFVMVDADMVFTPNQIEELVNRCGPGYEIVCADYPVHNGQSLAGQFLRPGHVNEYGLVEMERVPAGCMAVHRSAVHALTKILPLCHGSLPIAYWPFFIPYMGEPIDGDNVPLSEDFAFGDRARALGLHAWRDINIKIGHMSEVMLTEDNMASVHQALVRGW